MKRLSFGFKLMLALVAMVVVAVGTVGVQLNLAVNRHFEDYLSLESRPRIAALAPVLADYYASQGNWANVETLLTDTGMSDMHGGMNCQLMGSMQLVLADEKGTVFVDPSGQYLGERLNAAVLKQVQGIQASGRTVGYLMAQSGPREQAFRTGLNTSLFWAGILAILAAIVLGSLLTRTVVEPLRVVRDAARRLGTGDLTHRIPVTSSDEIGELAQQFNEMATALQRDEELRQRLTADIAHELRTPLAVIRGQVEALQDGVFPLTLENIAPLYDQTLLLGRLVDDLRDLALAEAGRLPLERTEVALETLIPRVVSAFRSHQAGNGPTLTTTLPEKLPLVDVDPQRLEQVLGNLLSNAFRHTPSEGTILIRAWADAEAVYLAVQDSGSGIAAEDLPHIFDRFYRADPARRRADGSTGLGLSIAKKLVEAHGGSINVESTLGLGSTFTVRLPRAVA